MFTHLLQIASFKSGPQHFKTPIYALIMVAVLYIGVQSFVLSLSPGNELIRMLVASVLKALVLAAVLFAWMKSTNLEEHFPSTLMVVFFAFLLAEVIKMPLSAMVRETKDTADLVMALVYSVPIWATMAWSYLVFYYVVKQISDRSKGELIGVVFTCALVSEVAGSVFSQVGTQLGP